MTETLLRLAALLAESERGTVHKADLVSLLSQDEASKIRDRLQVVALADAVGLTGLFMEGLPETAGWMLTSWNRVRDLSPPVGNYGFGAREESSEMWSQLHEEVEYLAEAHVEALATEGAADGRLLTAATEVVDVWVSGNRPKGTLIRTFLLENTCASEPVARARSVGGLGKIEVCIPDQNVAALLDDGDFRVRIAALTTIAVTDREHAGEHALRGLLDADARVRCASLRALSFARPQGWMEAVQRATTDPSEDVEKVARELVAGQGFGSETTGV